MTNIIKYPPTKLMLKFDKQQNKFLAIHVQDMEANQNYYLLEANQQTISYGIFCHRNHAIHSNLKGYNLTPTLSGKLSYSDSIQA